MVLQLVFIMWRRSSNGQLYCMRTDWYVFHAEAVVHMLHTFIVPSPPRFERCQRVGPRPVPRLGRQRVTRANPSTSPAPPRRATRARHPVGIFSYRARRASLVTHPWAAFTTHQTGHVVRVHSECPGGRIRPSSLMVNVQSQRWLLRTTTSRPPYPNGVISPPSHVVSAPP